jgi:hypothetical protein
LDTERFSGSAVSALRGIVLNTTLVTVTLPPLTKSAPPIPPRRRPPVRGHQTAGASAGQRQILQLDGPWLGTRRWLNIAARKSDVVRSAIDGQALRKLKVAGSDGLASEGRGEENGVARRGCGIAARMEPTPLSAVRKT